jgi:UDP-glucose 4-epimerase
MILGGECPVIYGDGMQSRDFTYVANVVHANLLCCDTDVSFGIFNVACGRRITIMNLINEINNSVETKIEPVFTKPRKGDVKHSQADITLARKFLAYEPVMDFQEGLGLTLEYFGSRSLSSTFV